jgi:peptidoglycan/xylan/chitin deacetylase (PgdA/CDA1 family)
LRELGGQSPPAYPSCFFASAGDIKKNAGLIREIYAGGHTVGI